MSRRINGQSRLVDRSTGRIRRLLRSRLVVILALAVFSIVGFTLGRELVRRQSVSRDVEKLQLEISSLEKQNIELESLLAYLKSPTYLEEEARLKLGLKKSGESVIAIPAESGDQLAGNINSTGGSRHPSDTAKTEANPVKWWRYLSQQTD